MLGFLLVVLSTNLLSTVGMYYITRGTFGSKPPENERETNLSQIALVLYWIQAVTVLFYSIYYAVKPTLN